MEQKSPPMITTTSAEADVKSLTCVSLKDTHFLAKTVKAFVSATFGCLNVT